MKKFIIFQFLLFMFISCGTYKPVMIEPISEEFQVEKSKEELYVSANNWMAENFISSKSVIQFSDKEAGVVTGRYLLFQGYDYYNYSFHPSEKGSVYAIIKIQVKDGASKITIKPETYQQLERNSPTEDAIYGKSKKNNYYPKQKAIEDINNLIQTYGNYIKNDNSSNW